MRRWTIEELNREHPLPDGWAWDLWGDGSGEVNVLPVAVSGKRWVATRGGGDTLSSIDDMERRDAPSSVCLAVLLATAGHDHPARVELQRDCALVHECLLKADLDELRRATDTRLAAMRRNSDLLGQAHPSEADIAEARAIADVLGREPVSREHQDAWDLIRRFAESRRERDRVASAAVPTCTGWWWCMVGGVWECLFVHDPTGDGLEVHLGGPIDRFACDRWGPQARPQDADELLAAREEIARIRARVRVEAEDVDLAGVTAEKVNAWLAEQTKIVEGALIHPWRRIKTIEHGVHAGAHWTHFMFDGVLDVWNTASSVANAINRLARFMRRPGLDILDEMSSLEVQP